MSSALTSDVCRLGVQRDAVKLDLVLPAHMPLAELMPSIVDICGLTSTSSWLQVPTDWLLSRIDGHPLSPRLSLRDNGVCDGDLLVLHRAGIALTPPPADDAIASMATSLDQYARWTPEASRVASAIVASCCTALTAYALVHSDSQAAAAIAVAVSAVAFAGAVVCGRFYGDTRNAVTLGTSAAAFAAVAGYRAVPGEASAPKLMLTTAVCATVSILAARCTGSGTTVFVGVVTAAVLSAVSACLYLFVPMRVSTAGAVLAAAAAVVLFSAARLAMSASRLPVPRLPAAPRPTAGDARGDVVPDVRTTHAMHTGLVCGASAAAAVGATLTMLDGPREAAAFGLLVGLVLVLRAGTHVDLVQTGALILAGATCFAAVYVWALGAWPHNAHWISLGAAAVVVAVLWLSTASPVVSPLRRRCVELIEYAALAALIPLACWVCGVFATVRGL